MVVTINADILTTMAWCCYLGEFGTTGCRATGLAMRAPFAGLELDPIDFKLQYAIKCEHDHIKYPIKTCKRTLRHFVALVGWVRSTSEAGWRWNYFQSWRHWWRHIVTVVIVMILTSLGSLSWTRAKIERCLKLFSLGSACRRGSFIVGHWSNSCPM